MPSVRSVDQYFQIIRDNHRKYLEHNMVTHLELTGGSKQAKLIQKYVEKIGQYHSSTHVGRYLNKAIEELSTASKIGHGALAALLGIGVGGAVSYAAQQDSVLDIINPLGEVKNVAANVFSTMLGAGVSYLTYEALKKSAEGAAAPDYNEFQSLMQQAGFTNKKYAQLSEALVKLFHFRECLLLDLKDGADNPMCKELKKKYLLDSEPIDQEVLNKAIEVYFLGQLNILFNDAFKEIYNIHDEEIKKDGKQYEIVKWIKKFFEDPRQRAKFTQQMQVEFMEKCLNYLEAKMVEPGFLAKHPYAISMSTGLIAGAIAIGIAVAVLGGPIGFGIASIGLAVACISAVATYFAVNKIEDLHYKRGKENRKAIQQVIEDITNESVRLSRLIKNQVETTPDDIKQLEKYKGEGENQGFLYHFNLFAKDKSFAMGSASSWIREYASRYRHNKLVVLDLSKQFKEIIEKGQNQTRAMQTLLATMMRGGNTKTPQPLKDFINNTKEHLKKPEHQDFITKFELVDKIKQQFLEIVAVTPSAIVEKKLPEELVEFYTLPVKDGGLGGLKQDLDKAMNLAPIAPENAEANSEHPLNYLLNTAQRFNFALTQDKDHEFILMGDDAYRAILGLRVGSPNDRIESKINAGNIQHYLNQSFDFLLSLNKPVKADESSLDKPFLNSDEFVLYRMLFIRQLAGLADSNNLRVESSVKQDIENFVKEKLQIDPKVVFDDVLNQALFITGDKDGPTITDPLGTPRHVNDIELVADALRLDLAYSSKPMTPRQLIVREVNDFLLGKGTEKTIFNYENSKGALIPEASEDYVSRIKDVIATTKELIAQMGAKNVLLKSGVLASYIYDAHKEINGIRRQIEALKNALPEESSKIHLQTADELLKSYHDELGLILATNESIPLASSISRFGLFSKKPAVNLSLYKDWELVEIEFKTRGLQDVDEVRDAAPQM